MLHLAGCCQTRGVQQVISLQKPFIFSLSDAGLLSLISGFTSHVGRSSVFPILPNLWRWAWGQTPSWGGEAALEAGGGRALSIPFPLLFREVCSKLQLLVCVFSNWMTLPCGLAGFQNVPGWGLKVLFQQGIDNLSFFLGGLHELT